jgi:hypothetical protein
MLSDARTSCRSLDNVRLTIPYVRRLPKGTELTLEGMRYIAYGTRRRVDQGGATSAGDITRKSYASFGFTHAGVLTYPAATASSRRELRSFKEPQHAGSVGPRAIGGVRAACSKLC